MNKKYLKTKTVPGGGGEFASTLYGGGGVFL